jgi:hypothetical protein
MASDGLLYNTLRTIENNLLGVAVVAIIIGGAATWAHKMYSTYKDAEVQKERIRSGLELKVGDYNGNQILDKFYEINGQKVPVEVDGKPVAEYFKK